MKLGVLRAAIRKSKAAPTIVVSVGDSPKMTLVVQKASILDQLEHAYPGGKGVETGLEFDDASGIISGPPILEVVGWPTPKAAEPLVIEDPESLALDI